MYEPKEWHEAYAILASGGAVIAGLLIVATAVRADEILSSLHWRLRARNSTLSMVTIMIGSTLVLLPQDAFVLGVELVVFNLTSAVLLPVPVIVNELRKHEGLSIRVPLLAAFFYFIAVLGGVSLIVHWGGGLYLPYVRLLGVFALSRRNGICIVNAASEGIEKVRALHWAADARPRSTSKAARWALLARRDLAKGEVSAADPRHRQG